MSTQQQPQIDWTKPIQLRGKKDKAEFLCDMHTNVGKLALIKITREDGMNAVYNVDYETGMNCFSSDLGEYDVIQKVESTEVFINVYPGTLGNNCPDQETAQYIGQHDSRRWLGTIKVTTYQDGKWEVEKVA